MKCGTVRDDGKVLWRNSKEKGQIWLTAEQYKKRIETIREYRRKSAAAYYARREKINPIDRPYFGKYDFASNTYYAGISSAGKEVWMPKEKFERFAERKKKHKQKHVEKLKALPKTNAKIGDPHPDNKNLFVVYINGNKPIYGDKEKLRKRRESQLRSYKIRDQRNRKMKREMLERLGENRIYRGCYDIKTGKVFWEYDNAGREIWIDEDIFFKKRQHAIDKRKNARLKQKGLQ